MLRLLLQGRNGTVLRLHTHIWLRSRLASAPAQGVAQHNTTGALQSMQHAVHSVTERWACLVQMRCAPGHSQNAEPPATRAHPAAHNAPHAQLQPSDCKQRRGMRPAPEHNRARMNCK